MVTDNLRTSNINTTDKDKEGKKPKDRKETKKSKVMSIITIICSIFFVILLLIGSCVIFHNVYFKSFWVILKGSTFNDRINGTPFLT